MAKKNFELNDDTAHLLNYYLKRSQGNWDEVINIAIKKYICDQLNSQQVKDALQHTGKDAFPAEDVLRNFGDNWMQD
ncbi:hypothetical protein [uncultured Lactobacillus sp.]|uniref:hypothetical protein n=1 Tax=uncultured Lactobacillus sp. TaxID=153152 RepID=UPI002617E00C|nr:hypothetical protein [uncultured Lactobacillus sp.]